MAFKVGQSERGSAGQPASQMRENISALLSILSSSDQIGCSLASVARGLVAVFHSLIGLSAF